MKHLLSTFATLLFISVVIASCKVEKPLSTNFTTFADSLSESHLSTKLSIDLPQAENAFDHLVLTQLNTLLGGTYTGKLTDGKALTAHYTAQKMETLKALMDSSWLAKMPADMQLTDETTFTLLADMPHYCTLLENNYTYTGGAHGSTGVEGFTFIKPLGLRFNTDCIIQDEGLHALIVEGLKNYFEVKTDAQLMDCLLTNNTASITTIPFPQTAPYIDKDSVVFLYQQYEITPYAAGIPSISIPLKKMKAYIRPNIYKLLTEGSEAK